MAGVAVGADGTVGVVGELLAASLLRDALPVLPVAKELAVVRVADRSQVGALDFRRDVLRQCPAVRGTARALCVILLQAIEPGLVVARARA